MTDHGASAEVRVTCADEAAHRSAVQTLVADGVASAIAARTPTLWGETAVDEASKRLGWVDLHTASRPLVDRVAELRDRFTAAGLDHVVLCGMGGSSLAPEVICATHGVELTVLDSSDPDYVRRALADRLERTVVVVSSKSGSTVETDSQKRAYEQALRDAGRDVADHLVIVTDPGSPLDQSSREAGYTVVNADPEVGGRFSALTAFRLVPSGLAGADIGRLLDEAAAVAPSLAADDPDNPALRLGALLAVANAVGVDKLVLADNDSGLPGLGDWAEQLVAESTGKDGTGILPVVVGSTDAPNYDPSTPDEVLVALGRPDPAVRAASGWSAAVQAPLGGAMPLWEYAIAVAGRLLGINPFDQPDVESAKLAAREMLEGGAATPEPAFTEGPIAVHPTQGLLDDSVATVAGAVDALLGRLDPDSGYLAVMAYLDRVGDAGLAEVRDALARRTARPVTFGWGPRFLHSTGQYHKGGPDTGVYLQVTTEPIEDLPIPGRPFTFGGFIAAQAIGDGSVLADHGRPVLRLHLTDHDAGLAVVRQVLGG